MHSPFTLDRRRALALGLGAVPAPFLPGAALAQEKMQILVAYYGALVNAGIVAIGQEKGFYKTAAVDASDVVSTIGGGTAIRNMIGGGVDYGIVGTSAALTAIRSGVEVRIVHGVIRTLEDEIGRIVRARVTNPKWIAGVMRHGYKGAFEIAASVDYLFAFAATTHAVRDHHFDAVHAAFIEDEAVRAFMADANPAALRETAARLAECFIRTPSSRTVWVGWMKVRPT